MAIHTATAIIHIRTMRRGIITSVTGRITGGTAGAFITTATIATGVNRLPPFVVRLAPGPRSQPAETRAPGLYLL